MKDKNYLHQMFNGTSTDAGNGDIETYENWLERQLLARIERLEQLAIDIVVERFSGENLQKLQKHFVSLYGSNEMAQEKANSFAVGFGKACELIIKDLNAL